MQTYVAGRRPAANQNVVVRLVTTLRRIESTETRKVGDKYNEWENFSGRFQAKFSAARMKVEQIHEIKQRGDKAKRQQNKTS